MGSAFFSLSFCLNSYADADAHRIGDCFGVVAVEVLKYEGDFALLVFEPGVLGNYYLVALGSDDLDRIDERKGIPSSKMVAGIVDGIDVSLNRAVCNHFLGNVRIVEACVEVVVGAGEFGTFVLLPIIGMDIVVLGINLATFGDILFGTTLEEGECYNCSNK